MSTNTIVFVRMKAYRPGTVLTTVENAYFQLQKVRTKRGRDLHVPSRRWAPFYRPAHKNKGNTQRKIQFTAATQVQLSMLRRAAALFSDWQRYWWVCLWMTSLENGNNQYCIVLKFAKLYWRFMYKRFIGVHFFLKKNPLKLCVMLKNSSHCTSTVLL